MTHFGGDCSASSEVTMIRIQDLLIGSGAGHSDPVAMPDDRGGIHDDQQIGGLRAIRVGLLTTIKHVHNLYS
jgi:hypothetical protein